MEIAPHNSETRCPLGFRLGILPGSDLTEKTDNERRAMALFASQQSTCLEPLRVPGSRLPLSVAGHEGADVAYLHFSGGKFAQVGGFAACPSCQTELFPMFRLNLQDQRLAEIVRWPFSVLELPVCPGCILGFQDYWADFRSKPFAIILNDARSVKPSIRIATPYETRAVILRQLLPEEYPGEDELVAEHVSRPYHQIGGVPPRWSNEFKELPCCRCNRHMRYCGVIDYDDENVPLFEDESRSPVAFCLGDMHSYYFYTCADCMVIGFQYVP